MKKVALSVVALALTAGSALAADLPSRKAPPVLLPPPPPAPLWTGFYVGLNAGGTWASSNTITTTGYPIFSDGSAAGLEALPVSAALASSSLSANSGGFVGGGQVGYNWQFYNRFVVGVEADIQGVAGNSNNVSGVSAANTVLSGPLVSVSSARRNIDYIGTVRGRLGWLATPTLLLYGTGGLAYGGVTLNSSVFQQLAGTAYFSNAAFSDTRVGWTAGGGVEWMFWPNWSAKVEYLYYDLGNVTVAQNALVNVGAAGNFTGVAPQTTTRFNGHLVRAGLNYHFNWGAPAPVVAKY